MLTLTWLQNNFCFRCNASVKSERTDYRETCHCETNRPTSEYIWKGKNFYITYLLCDHIELAYWCVRSNCRCSEIYLLKTSSSAIYSYLTESPRNILGFCFYVAASLLAALTQGRRRERSILYAQYERVTSFLCLSPKRAVGREWESERNARS